MVPAGSFTSQPRRRRRGKNALSQHDEDGLLYVIVSRMHQKWYVGMVEKWRKVAGRTDELPAGVERQSEHYEGMADPEATRLGSGAKYTLWKPYELWDQCMFPVHRDTIPRIEKLEQYVIATDQPPAHRDIPMQNIDCGLL